MSNFTTNDLYEEIKQQQATTPTSREIQEFYAHWGAPFKSITGAEKEADEPP